MSHEPLSYGMSCVLNFVIDVRQDRQTPFVLLLSWRDPKSRQDTCDSAVSLCVCVCVNICVRILF